MFKSYKILKLNRAANSKISNFIKRNHYSKSVSRGNKYVFTLLIAGKLRGVATFGTPVGRRCQEMYSTGKGEILECKRFCLAPRAPKNTASWFMAKCIKQLKRQSNIETVLSYADPEAGHEGTMYKASNFVYRGLQGKATQAIKMQGVAKPFHLRVVYQKINGTYTKTATKVQNAMKQGLAKSIYLAPKHVFTYKLK